MNPRKRRLVRSVMNSYASTEKEFHDYVKGQVTHQQEEKTKSKEKDLLEREAQKEEDLLEQEAQKKKKEKEENIIFLQEKVDFYNSLSYNELKKEAKKLNIETYRRKKSDILEEVLLLVAEDRLPEE
jgi:hypothetical protein